MNFLHIDKNNANKSEGTNSNPITKLDEDLNNSNAKVFMLIYMEGCGPCNAVRPEWKKMQNILKNNKNNKDDIIIVDIDKDFIHKVKKVKDEPSGFPTIRYITNKGETVENYEDSNVSNKDRSIDSFIEWINLKTNENKSTKPNRKINQSKKSRQYGGKTRKIGKMIGGKWSLKYKRSINCKRPKGFSQKQHCKYGRKK